MRLSSVALVVLGLASFACEKAPPAPAVAAPASDPSSTSASSGVTGTTGAPGASAGELTVGKAPPTFSVTAHDGTKIDLKERLGKQPIVVYFYPKDETPGCTTEACSFRDNWVALEKANVLLIGVSADSLDSHKAFAEHHKLPFKLVSDADGAIAKSYGVPFQGYTGRQSFVIGKDGNVKKIYRTVDVTAHAQQILADVNGG